MAEISKREQKKLLAKQTIMETAIEQFVQRGFQAASIADIMKAAHMGLGTFYNYFDSKDQLLHYLLDNLAVQLQQRLQHLTAEQKSKAEILREMVLMTAQLVDSNKYVLPLFLSAGARPEQASEGLGARKRIVVRNLMSIEVMALLLWPCFCSWCRRDRPVGNFGRMFLQKLLRKCSILCFRQQPLAVCL